MLTPKKNLLEHIKGGNPEYTPMTLADVHLCGFFYPHEQPLETGKDIFGIPWIVTPEGAIPEPGIFLLEDIRDWRDVVHFPDVDAIDFEAIAAAESAAIPPPDRNEKMYSLMTACGPWERLIAFMGCENALCALMEEPEECSEFFNAMADFKIAVHNKLIDAYKPDIFIMCDDVSHSRSMFMSPDTYRSLIKPAHKKIVEAITARGVLFQMHCCGKCEPVVPDFVEIGVKLWQSAQPQNDLAGILERFKGQLAVEGGWDTSGPASRIDATEETIRAEVRRCMGEYKKTGFVLLPALMNENGNGFLIGDSRMGALIEEWMKYRNF